MMLSKNLNSHNSQVETFEDNTVHERECTVSQDVVILDGAVSKGDLLTGTCKVGVLANGVSIRKK